MYYILAIIIVLLAVDHVRRRREGTPRRSVVARTVRNRVAVVTGVSVAVLTLLVDGLVSGNWGASLLFAVFLGLVIALLLGVTTGGSGPLGKRERYSSGRTPS